jgi:hypothetical protein
MLIEGTDETPCLLITGAKAKVGAEVVSFTGWTLIDVDEDVERRIHVRFAMPRSAAIDLYKQLSDEFENA